MIERKSLPKQISEIIERKIKEGEYNIGDKLPTEPNLVQIFGVSRNTIREAVQSLINSGILKAYQGDGVYVVAKERLQVDFYNIMNETTEKNIFEVRDMLEKQIVILAINNASDEDMKKIEETLLLRKNEFSSAKENTQSDLNFHMAIAEATHNDIILNIYKYVSEYIRQHILIKILEKDINQEYLDEVHDLLFEAIKNRDVKKALEYVEKIIEV